MISLPVIGQRQRGDRKSVRTVREGSEVERPPPTLPDGADRDKRVYTIKVKRKRKDEEFSFKDLEMYHCECYGGGPTIQNWKKKKGK